MIEFIKPYHLLQPLRLTAQGLFMLVCLLLAGLTGYSAKVFAVAYSLDNTVSVRGRFDDNGFLSVGFKDELYGGTLSHALDFSRATETTAFNVGLDLDANQYNIDAYSTFDQRLDLGYSSTNELGGWRLNALMDRGSTRESELTTAGTGFFDLRDTRTERYELNASYDRNVGDRNFVQVNLAASDVAYDSGLRTDYFFGNTSVLWQYILNERLRLQANAVVSLLDTDLIDGLAISPVIPALGVTLAQIPSCRQSGTFDLNFMGGLELPCLESRLRDNKQITERYQLGVYYLFSENLTINALVGQSTVDTDSSDLYPNLPDSLTPFVPREVVTQGKNRGLSYSADIDYELERLRLAVNAQRSNEVNSNGILVLTQSASIRAVWEPRLHHSVVTKLEWFDQETTSQGIQQFNDRRLSTFLFRYNYRFNENWRIQAEYRIDEQLRALDDRESYSNQWSLTLLWRPTTLKWSR